MTIQLVLDATEHALGDGGVPSSAQHRPRHAIAQIDGSPHDRNEVTAPFEVIARESTI